MGAVKQGRTLTDRDKMPYMAVREEPGVQEEMLCRGERIVIPEGQDKKDKEHGESDTYRLANPGLAEAPDVDHSTVVPRTGADRSSTQTLMDTNLLYTQHQHEDEEDRHIAKNEAVSNLGDAHQYGADTKTKAVTNNGDPLHGDTHHGKNDSKADTSIGNTLQGDSKAETNLSDSKADTNIGDPTHGNTHHGNNESKADTSIADTPQGNSKAETNLGDSYQAEHSAGDVTKAKTNLATSSRATPTMATTTPRPTPATATPSKVTPATARTGTRP